MSLEHRPPPPPEGLGGRGGEERLGRGVRGAEGRGRGSVRSQNKHFSSHRNQVLQGAGHPRLALNYCPNPDFKMVFLLKDLALTNIFWKHVHSFISFLHTSFLYHLHLFCSNVNYVNEIKPAVIHGQDTNIKHKMHHVLCCLFRISALLLLSL